MFKFFGTKSSKVGSVNLVNSNCPNCNSQSTLKATKYGNYFHVFFLPILPTSQNVLVECSHCHKKFENVGPETFGLIGDVERKELIQMKKPKWHGCGCVLIFLLSIFSLVSTCTGYLSNNEEINEELNGPLRKMYEEDNSKLTRNPDCKTDSVSCAIKDYFKLVLTDELDQDKFKYFSKVKGAKVLIIVEIRDMKKVETSMRSEFINLIIEGAQHLENMEEAQYYIAVEGKWNTVLVYTPNERDLGGNFASEKYLFNFYTNDSLQVNTKN